MPIKTWDCVQSLEENSKDVYLETSSVLLKLMDNILRNPANIKYRSIRLENPIVSTKLLPAIGAMECLFEMGFQEGDGRLVLPENSCMEHIKEIRNEIFARRNIYLQSPSKERQCVASVSEPKTTVADVQPIHDSDTMVTPKPFLDLLRNYSQSVFRYEDKELQSKALKLIPLGALEIKAERKMFHIRRAIKQGNKKEQEIDISDVLLMELLNWFKNSFFTWVDAPQCCYCQGETKFSGLSTNPKDLRETSRVEVYNCRPCSRQTLFPRYNDPEKLLETRRGRCGEWANCFTLMCRSLGWDTRHVVDQTDHVWTEVYSMTQERWLHCDPCENACDTPLMYEHGWGKKLTYVMSFSCEDVQDVTWRYSCRHSEVLARRTLCSEEELLSTILQLRSERQSRLSPARQTFLTKRLLRELIEFLSSRQPGEEEHKGRSSGSLLWRLARGETGIPAATPYTWQPTNAEREACEMNISYSMAQDKYLRGTTLKEVLLHWEKGAFHIDSIFRKEETDWKIVYLARLEGSTKGSIQWKVDCTNSGLVIDSISVKCVGTVFETGKVQLLLCNEETCIPFPSGASMFETRDLCGSTSFTLSVVLTGGKGNVAWQHAQLFRQQIDNIADCPLNIIVKLKKP